jgi:hypothetical protein
MLLAMVANTMAADDVEQAQALARRLSPALAGKVEFRKIAAADGKDVFTLGSERNKVIIGGNNAG